MVRDVELADLRQLRCAFWSFGNSPTQATLGLDAREVVRHLKCLFLLVDRVLASPSFMFESSATREAFACVRAFFEEGALVFFLDEALDGYGEHADQKTNKSVLPEYQDHEFTQTVATALDELPVRLRRPGISISDRIVALWLADVVSQEPGSIGAVLAAMPSGRADVPRVRDAMLQSASQRSARDFVWEYIEPTLSAAGAPAEVLRHARRRLTQMYATATAGLLGVPSDSAVSHLLDAPSSADSALLLECLRLLELGPALDSVSGVDLLALKLRPEYHNFMGFYRALVDASAGQPSVVRELLPLSTQLEDRVAAGRMSASELLQRFESLCRTREMRRSTWKRPIDVILRTWEAFERRPVRDFVDEVRRVGASESEHLITHPEWSCGSAPNETREERKARLLDHILVFVERAIANDLMLPAVADDVRRHRLRGLESESRFLRYLQPRLPRVLYFSRIHDRSSPVSNEELREFSDEFGLAAVHRATGVAKSSIGELALYRWIRGRLPGFFKSSGARRPRARRGPFRVRDNGPEHEAAVREAMEELGACKDPRVTDHLLDGTLGPEGALTHLRGRRQAD